MAVGVRGYLVYKDVWEVAVGETLVCSREPRNSHNRYAVAIEKNSIRHPVLTKESVTRLFAVAEALFSRIYTCDYYFLLL